MLFAKNKKQKTRTKDSPHFHVARPRRRPSGPPYLHSVYRPSCMAPVIWSQVPEITLPQRQLYQAFIYENVAPVGQVKVNPVWLFITLGEQSNEQTFLFFWVSLGHPIPVCFAELVFTFLIRISALNPKSRHYVTLATPRTVPGRRAKAFISRKVVPLARVTLPAEVRQLAHPSCLDPRDEFALVEVWKGTS